MAHVTTRDRILAEPLALKEEGSPEWCWQQLEGLRWAYTRLDSDWAQVETLRERLRAHEAWKKVPPDAAPFGDEDTMLREVVGVDIAAFDAGILARKQREQALAPEVPHGGDRRSGAFQGATSTLKTKKGSTSRDTTIRRLKRDNKELAEMVINGDLSANAAMIAAGLRKRATPLDQLRKAWGKASADERATFLHEIGE